MTEIGLSRLAQQNRGVCTQFAKCPPRNLPAVLEMVARASRRRDATRLHANGLWLAADTTSAANPRSLANFPMQANGAEMMRLACSLATEAAIGVCCPVHDAILVESPAEDIDVVVQRTQATMREASRIVLDGFELSADAKIVRYPDRYFDEGRGRTMWDKVANLVANTARTKPAGSRPFPGRTG